MGQSHLGERDLIRLRPASVQARGKETVFSLRAVSAALDRRSALAVLRFWLREGDLAHRPTAVIGRQQVRPQLAAPQVLACRSFPAA